MQNSARNMCNGYTTCQKHVAPRASEVLVRLQELLNRALLHVVRVECNQKGFLHAPWRSRLKCTGKNKLPSTDLEKETKNTACSYTPLHSFSLNHFLVQNSAKIFARPSGREQKGIGGSTYPLFWAR